VEKRVFAVELRDLLAVLFTQRNHYPLQRNRIIRQCFRVRNYAVAYNTSVRFFNNLSNFSADFFVAE
jgi:hypothetical protein